MFQYFAKDLPTAEGSIDLVAGRSYYMETYMINYQGPGFLSVSVEVPNTNPAASFLAYEVDNITTLMTTQ
jgi:hypothetical protein